MGLGTSWSSTLSSCCARTERGRCLLSKLKSQFMGGRIKVTSHATCQVRSSSFCCAVAFYDARSKETGSEPAKIGIAM